MMSTAPLVYRMTEGQPDGPLVILLHGRGADEGDLASVGGLLVPGATTISVRAPFPGAPWGYGGGYAWYRYLYGTTPEPESFRAGQARLAEFIEWIPGHLGRPDAACLVGGFSQGGTSSLAWRLSHPEPSRGVLVFSGFIADHPDVQVSPDAVRGAPIWWGHGSHDGAIPFEFAEAGWGALRAAGADLTAFTDVGAGHTISRLALSEASAFARRVLDRTR
jgi:phospholipase/carboxylesterase